MKRLIFLALSHNKQIHMNKTLHMLNMIQKTETDKKGLSENI